MHGSYFISGYHLHFRNSQFFIMAMPPNMILFLYATSCLLPCVFAKLTIFIYIHVHNLYLYHSYEKKSAISTNFCAQAFNIVGLFFPNK